MKMQSLRTKLILTHILPILLLTTLLSLYLLYSLEDWVTEKLQQRLLLQAEGLLLDVEQQPLLFLDSHAAEPFLTKMAPRIDAHLLLLSPSGQILGSTRVEYADQIGARYRGPGIEEALQAIPTQGMGRGLITDVIYVMLPVQVNDSFLGILRLSYEVDDQHAQFAQLRWQGVGGVSVIGLLGLGLGLALAVTITQPLHHLMQRIQAIAAGQYQARLLIQRQDEIGTLAHHFNQMAERLEEAEVARQRQLAAIVHELTRPLAGMRAAVETLIDEPPVQNEVQTALLSGVGEELERLERLTRMLRRLDTRALQPLQLTYAKLSIKRTIHGSVANFEPMAARLGIRLTMSLPPHLPPLCADEDRLIQVLTNLLDNALKFTPRGGKVTVAAGEEANRLWVRISDSGVGISADELPHIFQQFYRGAESRPPEKRGMGLGLTICHEIVMAHGGQIDVTSILGQGTQITIRLPIAREN